MTLTFYIILTAVGMLGIAMFNGLIEAHLFHYKSEAEDERRTYLHAIFTLQRAFILCMLLFSSLFVGHKVSYILHVFTVVFQFSLVHNGIYYMVRNRLNPRVYPRGFVDTSTTSTAYFELDFIH